MATILDVGQYITELLPGVDKMKLYKLCYFPKVGIWPGLASPSLPTSSKAGATAQSPHSCATTPRQWPRVTLNREEPGNRVMSIQTIHDEFANHIQSGKPSPKMPTQGSHDPAPSLADFRKSAAKISKEWNSVFELLATR